MRFFGFPALLGMVLLNAVGCATRSPRAEFLELEHAWVRALEAHDTAALDRLLDDTFLDSTFRGTLRTKSDVLKGPPAGGAYHTLRFDDLRVRTYGGDTAVVTGVNVLEGPRHDIVRVRFTDVFVRRNGRWRAVSAQETLRTD